MKNILIMFTILAISGCSQSGYKQFYNPYVDAKPLPNIQLLGSNEEPQVFGSNHLDRDIRTLLSKRYIVVGYSSFNGEYEGTKNAAAQAKRIGATVVLINSEYTNTQSSTSALLLPNNQTTYHSGSLYGGGSGGSYSGTSTTYGTTTVPFTTHQRRYDQVAVYLVKSTQKVRFGVSVNDLPPNLRSELERNTGALIDIVLEDTAAFYANVMAGDVLISIDGISVKNGKHAMDLMDQAPENQSESEFVVIRKGEEKSISIKL